MIIASSNHYVAWDGLKAKDRKENGLGTKGLFG